MLICKKRKDGGPDSNATGYWLIEIKPLFSILLLKFEGESRTNYHSHAFHALTWLIKGDMTEHSQQSFGAERHIPYRRSLFPKFTSRKNLHKVDSNGTSWVFSIRGPWKKEWQEYNPKTDKFITLTNGRKHVAT